MSVKNSLEVLDRLQAFEGPFETVDGALYATLPHSLIKQKFSYLVGWCFDGADRDCICCGREGSFFSDVKDGCRGCACWTCEEMDGAVCFLLDGIFTRFGNTVCRLMEIPVGAGCPPLMSDLFLYCYESQFTAKLHRDPSETDLIDKFNNAYSYLDNVFSVGSSDFYKY